MSIITLTSKRQATLPVELCKEFGIHPGDKLSLEKKVLQGKGFWILMPLHPKTEWFGSLKKYAEKKSHHLSDIRKSIGKGLKR